MPSKAEIAAQWRRDNPERYAEQQRRYVGSHREERRQAEARRRAAKPEQVKEEKRSEYQKNREKYIAYSKAYYEKNKEACIVRARVYKAAHKQRNREYLYDYVSRQSCMDCGESDMAVLEFDHVRGKKEGNLARAVAEGWSIARIEREIAKCDVVCCNCHRRRTGKRAGWYRHARAVGY